MSRETLAARKAAILDRVNVAGLVAELFDRRTPAGRDQVLVCCPVHDEAHASCSINTASGLWNCKACGAAGNLFDLLAAVWGCDFAAALDELEDRAGIATPTAGGSTRRAKPTPKKPTAPPKPIAKAKPAAPPVKGEVVAVYDYRDAAGVVRYRKRRIEPGRDGKPKEFSFVHPRPNGTEAPGRGDAPPLLYGLDRLVAAPAEETVFIVEGEKCCDALAAWGLIAVCNDSGAAGKWPEGYDQFFQGRHVVILPDHDEPGERYAAKVAAALLPVAATVKVLRLPGLPPKGDVCDWIAAHMNGNAADA
ncbi:CHC2 zinc finger domain-containing protein [Geoalkalibacter sp.]|uniref:CHC2 zinc finger domain-containing protein n=1 Tax=Geoalkalibacter sp. TaxID=3041440 RepID=UPI00272E8F1F|nr:CHC2 zinc finger domain-containing protein [Geoalkalibacter sp.]